MFPKQKAASKEAAFRFSLSQSFWLFQREQVDSRSTDGRSLQSHCTAGDPSRQHHCLSVSVVSDLLPGEKVVNR